MGHYSNREIVERTTILNIIQACEVKSATKNACSFGDISYDSF